MASHANGTRTVIQPPAGILPLEPSVAAELVPELARDLAAWLRSALPAGAALQADSRLVRPGDAFFAYPGFRSDGRRFLGDAITRGAAAVLCEAEGGAPLPEGPVPLRSCPGLRALAGSIASAYHGRPSETLDLVAVTGTNGKTSVTQWVARGFEDLGRRGAVIGTLGCGVAGHLEEVSGLTTPDALGLQSLLSRFVADGVDAVAAEASSIGLDQGRLNGTRIAVAAFTNLTRDHLDYHQTMEAYAQAKARLFGWPGLGAVVVNGDDPASPAMLAAVRGGPGAPRRIVYGTAPGRHGARGDSTLIAERVFEDGSGIQLTLSGDFGTADLRLRLLGLFNVSNALAVAGCWLALGHPFERVVEALERLEPVPGRMQTLEQAGAPLVVVDYAHSPDALDNVLACLRSVAIRRSGRLWCVFGAGGERDVGKRAQMGLVAERAADHLVITSDNPRGESPFRIVSDIRAGLIREPALTELDRAVAIRAAIDRAAPADVVLVAGKGHENYQEIGGVRHPFSDVDVAHAALLARPEACGV
ncbi:MAG TPA: UDP-N-acetylmuramoyl-L-alanyl-D-glutamate--2,6-diaminopimelate ligase [Quisquiliibacterium sp.]|nr:UDP-N-acetylmuramoyl-L-alanyl-D-glutamate--2,6-diaminopimelate ligase [Quisquiliibacterium sp.]